AGLPPAGIRTPIVVWVRITPSSRGVSLPGLSRMLSGTPIFPTSCSGAARRIRLETVSPTPRSTARAPAPRVGVRPGRVAPDPRSGRQSLQDLHLSPLQRGGALGHSALETLVLGLQGEVQRAGLDQVANPEEHFRDVRS